MPVNIAIAMTTPPLNQFSADLVCVDLYFFYLYLKKK